MFCNKDFTDIELFHITTCAEQILNTGGGYQDAIGSCYNGFRLIHFSPGLLPLINCEPIHIDLKTQQKLQDRVIFIYTGKTRVAKNLLATIMGNYMNNDTNTILTLKDIGLTALDMKKNLLDGDLKTFSQNMIKSFNLNISLNKNFSNNTIDSILNFFSEYSDGYMLSGAGNGGFLTILLNDCTNKEYIIKIFNSKFKDSNIEIYDFNIIF